MGRQQGQTRVNESELTNSHIKHDKYFRQMGKIVRRSHSITESEIKLANAHKFFLSIMMKSGF